jgi:hypothetical protein
MKPVDADLDLGDGVRLRPLTTADTTLLWLEIAPGNEPSLRLARRPGYRFEQRIPRHCRDWVSEDAEHDSWHDCLIWVHTAGSAPGAAGQAAPG